jgi:hypothetical protein
MSLPEKPWTDGDTFVNEETGVEYTFDGEKWLASGSEEADLSGFATKAFADEVDRTSQMRDEVLDSKIDQESTLNTAAHLKLEDQILRYYAWSVGDNEELEKKLEAADAELQKQITENKGASESGDRQLQEQIDELHRSPVALGTLRWNDFSWDSGNIDALGGTARFHPDRTKMALNHDTLDSGRVDWEAAFGDYPAEIGIGVEGETYRATINFTGTAGTNSRGKNFEIVESNLPAEVTRDAEVTFYDSYQERIVTKEYVDDGDRQLQAEIDQVALALETLLVQREHGKWKYVGYVIDNRPKPGEFALEDDLSQSTNYLAVNQTDMDGKFHGWGDISIGDYVEVVDLDNPSNYALWVIQDEPDGTGFTFFEVKLKDKGNNFLIGETCEIRFFQVNEQDLQLEDLDRRYLKKAGGDNMEGPLHVKGHSGDSRGTSRVKTLGVFSESNSALRLGTTTDRIYIEDENTKFNGGILVNNIGPKTEDGRGVTLNVEGTNDKHLITKKYVDTATDLDDRYLKLSGGTMAGSATLKVNVLEPVNTPMIQYNGDPDSTHAAGLINREMMRRYVAAELDKAPQSSPPMSAKLMVGFQLWSEGRLAEGCFNLLDEDKNPTSKIKSARFLTFHIIQGWDHVDWFKHDLRGKGQIHLTDLDGKYQMSKFVIGAEKHEALTGTNPVDALWFFELEEYGHEPDLTLSGNYFIEFDSCLEVK